uniref:Dual specificity phosphatase 22 n=1 Tax=Phasianus colchicus TaxID=9054 RepID=A0A669QV43_PHACC
MRCQTEQLCFFATLQVVTGLYLGNIRDSEDRDSLRRHGVTHILSVHNGAKPVLEVNHSPSFQR